MSAEHKIRVGVSVGDLHGVGLEVIQKAFSDPRMLQEVTPIVYGTVRSSIYHRKANHIEGFSFNKIDKAENANPKLANLIEVWKDEVKIEIGKPSLDNAKYAIMSLKTATEDLASGKVDVLVTAPIDKHSMKHAGFEYPGHTEFLAAFANTGDVLMIMVNEGLRIGTVTGHIPIKDVASTISGELIMNKVRLMNNSLVRDFQVIKPKIALLALNPHAGDNGAIGSEDQDVLIPAIRSLNDEGIKVFGPYPADGFFGSNEMHAFDGVMAMYHDQGLIPFKALSFQTGVNYTAGLPIVRTSPVHGTGLQIAGKGKADPHSFRHAVLLAKDIFRNRAKYREMNADPLQPQKRAEPKKDRA